MFVLTASEDAESVEEDQSRCVCHSITQKGKAMQKPCQENSPGYLLFETPSGKKAVTKEEEFACLFLEKERRIDTIQEIGHAGAW